MTRVAAHIDIAVPPALCIHAIQGTLGEARLLDAARALRPGKEYSGWVTVLVPDRRPAVVEGPRDRMRFGCDVRPMCPTRLVVPSPRSPHVTWSVPVHRPGMS